MQQPTAIAASLEDYDRSVASLVVAFICDPFIRWMFPDSKQYLHYFPLVLKYFAGRAFEHSSAYRSTDFKAAAMWLPPGVSPDEEALGAVIVGQNQPWVGARYSCWCVLTKYCKITPTELKG